MRLKGLEKQDFSYDIDPFEFKTLLTDCCWICQGWIELEFVYPESRRPLPRPARHRAGLLAVEARELPTSVHASIGWRQESQSHGAQNEDLLLFLRERPADKTCQPAVRQTSQRREHRSLS